MDNSNNNNLNILDLPNEMLINIFNRLYIVDILYSLVNINERFDRLVIDPLYIHHLDMTIELPFDEIISIYNKVFPRIYENILPRIHNQVNKLTVDSYSIKSILTVNYPQLYSLSLVNFQEEILFQYSKDILFFWVRFFLL
ncbi:unnamed protein product [Rotaria sordida]|uniref:F-box domain-containing protein n=1 Tax=Rotaria sordida TaxID=392033 RepID=A0A815Q702_9BILA|nr:unnamed protein product [Rotaria sordida]